MSKKSPSVKKSIHASRRYWYHLSSTIKHKQVLLKPWDNSRGFNRTDTEPNDERICVAPSIAHCLTAIPYSPGDTYSIYRTKSQVKANPPYNVFDAKVTREGWIQKPTVFVRVGTISIPDVEDGENKFVVEEAASFGNSQQSGKVLKWWKSKNLFKYVKRS